MATMAAMNGAKRNSTTVTARRPRRLPDRKALAPLVVGLAITLLTGAFNACMHAYRAPALFVASDSTDEDQAAGPGFLSAWLTVASDAVRALDDLAAEFMFPATDGARGAPRASDDIVVVAIDGASLRQAGAWPWSRRDIQDHGAFPRRPGGGIPSHLARRRPHLAEELSFRFR